MVFFPTSSLFSVVLEKNSVLSSLMNGRLAISHQKVALNVPRNLKSLLIGQLYKYNLRSEGHLSVTLDK